MAQSPATRQILRRTRLPQVVEARASVFSITRAASDTSRQIAFTDEFLSLASSAGATIVIPTPYNVPRLFELISQSNMIQQCIDAYVVNTVLTGWECEPATRGKEMDQGEVVEVDSFLEHANSEEGMTDVMEKVIRDREAVGFGFLEVIRDMTEAISLLRHCPSLWTRLCAKDPTEQKVEYTISRGRRVSTVTEYRRFRRYIQIVNGHQVWFKEFGDPRKMDFTNGAYEGQSGYDAGRQATELLMFKRPSNDSYGAPQWINQLPNILGSREAEEVNMRYFQDNTVPPMMLMVGNGRLTAQSFNNLKNTLNTGGAERQNKMLLIEAVGDGDSMDGKSSPIELKVEKLTDTRQSDGLFKAYDEGNMAKIRSSFRLPPITVGMSQDVNFATASTSAFVAESQVFGPERSKIDGVLNKMLIQGKWGLALKTVKLVSRVPSITSPDMMIKTLTALNVMGAVTPRSSQAVANKVLQVEIAQYPKKGEDGYEDWMDRPIVFAARGARGSDYDPGGLDQGQGGGDTVEPNPDQGGGVTPKGATPTSHAQQSVKDASVKAVEKTGNVGAARPKNGEQ